MVDSQWNTARRGNRYRYYINQALLHGKREGSRARVSADDAEHLIVEQLCRQEKRDDLVANIAIGVWSAETRELILTTVDQVVILRDEIEATFRLKERVASRHPSKRTRKARVKIA